jgi:hypothetical protein
MLRLSEQYNPRREETAQFLALRTRYFDDFLVGSVDHPVLELKDDILRRNNVRAAIRRIPVGADLQGDWIPPFVRPAFNRPSLPHGLSKGCSTVWTSPPSAGFCKELRTMPPAAVHLAESWSAPPRPAMPTRTSAAGRARSCRAINGKRRTPSSCVRKSNSGLLHFGDLTRVRESTSRQYSSASH